MKSFYILFFAFCAIFGLASAQSKCEKSRTDKADACAKKGYFLMDSEFRGLTSEDQLEGHCKRINSSITCVSKYGKDCLTGFTRQTLTISLHGMKKHYKSICGPKATLKKDFIENTNWIGKDENEELHTCATGSIKNMLEIVDNVESKDQIPQACCAYWLLRKCTTAKLTKLTTESKRAFIEKMTDDSMTNLIEFLCSKQDSIATCQKLMPDAMKKMEKVYKEVKKSDRNKKESYLLPFLDIVTEK